MLSNNKKQINLPPKERKIFLNNMNSWFSNFVIEALRTEMVTDPKITKNEFMGTRNNSNMKLPHLFEPTEVKIDYNHHFEHEVFKNDVFIYNLEEADYNEIEYLIKGLKTLKHPSEKVLIIVSSIMTWARTNPKVKKEKVEGDDMDGTNNNEEESEDEEIIEDDPEDESNMEGSMEGNMDNMDNNEPPKKFLPFKDRDFISRIPAKKYYHYKMIETLALAAANTNPMLKTYIVCPGFIYGCGEDIFYEYFKMAWLQDPFKLPIIGEGKNSIPTIHILDLVSVIKRIIERKPNLKTKYIFAVDRTKNRSLKNIITSVSKSTGSGFVDKILDLTKTESINNIPAYNELSINVKCKTSKVFEDQKLDDEDQEDFEKRCFKWHCEFGIPNNLEKLRKEFTTYRNLKAQKLFITGPPASGKSTLAEKLSKFYNLPHIKIKDVIDYGKELKDELGEEINAKIEELRDKALEEWEEAQKKIKGKKKQDPPERSTINPRLPDDLVVKILKRRLRENMCRNRGYILDGYPRGYEDAKLAFTEVDPEKPDEDPLLQDDILPNSVICLDGATDDLLKNRIKLNPELAHLGPHYTDESMTRRINQYKLLNESIKGDLSISDFFKNKSELRVLDCKSQEKELFTLAKVFLERHGPIQNYQKFDEQEEQTYKDDFEGRIEDELKVEDKEINENEFFENQKQEQKKEFNEDKLKQLKERERQLLEKKSEVLRRYLHENVIPILSKGILEVAKELPNDPVDFLADFLFENSMKVKFPPTKYKDN